jgi:DNA-binding transcriptional MerR regulator
MATTKSFTSGPTQRAKASPPRSPAGSARLEFTTRQAADLVGVTARTLRYYEEVGLLPAPRRGHGGLVYSEEHILKLLRVTRLTAMGLSLEEVADVARNPGSARSTQVLSDLDRALADRVAEIQGQRRAISQLRQTQSPVDIVPEFARHVAALRRLGLRDTAAADRLLLDAVAAFPDPAAASQLADVADQAAADPLSHKLAALEGRLQAIDAQSTGRAVAALALDYGQLLTEIYDAFAGDGGTLLAEGETDFADGVLRTLIETAANDQQRDVLSRAVTVLAAHLTRDES